MKIVYQTDAHGVFVGTTEADESPLEPGVWLLPAGCVEVPPPATTENTLAVWRGGSWQVISRPPEDIAEENPGKSPEELLELERMGMTLSFAQCVVGLVEQKWITPTEAEGWLAANSLPATVEAAINTLPATAPDGSMPRLRARARALRPSEIHRSNQLLLLMASMRKATEADLDDFFRVYAAI